MPFKDSTMEDTDKHTPSTDKAKVIPVFNHLQSQTEIPVGADVPVFRDDGPAFGDDLVFTTYVTVTEDDKTHVETVTRTITVTTGTEQGTVTVTMDPSTLATFPALGSLPHTVTATVTALPHGKVCTTIGTAAGVPIACFFGAGALMLGIYLWLQHRNRDGKRRRDSATTALTISDSSFEDPAAPVPYARDRGRHSIDGGPGTMAPPPSLDAHADGPFADPSSSRNTRTSVFRTPEQYVNVASRDNYVYDYSDIGPGFSPDSDTSWAPLRYGFRRRFRSRPRPTNGEMDSEPRGRPTMDNGEVSAFENDPSGRTRFPNELRTVAQNSSANDGGDVGPVIRPAQTEPLRPTEVAGGGYVSQRASIIDDPDYTTPPHSPRLAAAAMQGPSESEFGPVTRGLSSKGKGKARAEDDASMDEDDDNDALHLGKDSPFELSADNPIHELSTDCTIATFDNSGHKNVDNISAYGSDGGQDNGTKIGNRAGQRVESLATQ